MLVLHKDALFHSNTVQRAPLKRCINFIRQFCNIKWDKYRLIVICSSNYMIFFKIFPFPSDCYFVCLFQCCPIYALIRLMQCHRYLEKSRLPKFVMCQLPAQPFPRAFLQRPLIVLTRETRQAVCAIHQPIFL